MRFLLFLFLALGVRADWKSDLRVYWFNNTHPGIALTASNIVSVEHVTGNVTSVQIGDHNGILSGLCTGFISDGVCGGSVQNCQWGRRFKQETNDSFFFHTCRPVTTGIQYIQTNTTVGSHVTILSVVDKLWHNATVNYADGGFVYSFPDGETAYLETMICEGWNPASASGSAVFTPTGDYVGTINASSAVTNAIIHTFYPSGSTYRPATPVNTGGAAGLSALFNSDPDR